MQRLVNLDSNRKAGTGYRSGSKKSFGRVLPGLALSAVLFAVSCTPTVKVEAPDKPITINLNVKLDAEVRVKLEEKAEQDVQTKPIF